MYPLHKVNAAKNRNLRKSSHPAETTSKNAAIERQC